MDTGANGAVADDALDAWDQWCPWVAAVAVIMAKSLGKLMIVYRDEATRATTGPNSRCRCRAAG